MFVDTNVIVRHLTGDPPEQAGRATRFLAESENLLLPDLVLGECVFVLQSYYGLERSAIAGLMRSLLGLPLLGTLDEPLLLRALALYEHVGLHFVEAYLVAAAELSGVGRVASFDQSIDRVATVDRVEP